MDAELEVGDVVVIPWGIDEVLGTVVEVYGTSGRVQVVVGLSPELSSYVVDEPTTVALPRSAVRHHVSAA
ncbi:MAG: hypothetical protein M3137_15325 [Actinomycetota bacterium]|nr:hypothetical protein [Actinomycetota bacterium]